MTTAPSGGVERGALTLIAWEDRLTRLVAAMLLAAGAYGLVAGAHVAMYYDVVPNMGAREDTLGVPAGLLYVTALVLSLAHLPLAAWDARHSRWRAAAMRAFVFMGPVVVILGTEGLISHYLWWLPISTTDRFHLLHHSLVAGVPLALAYGLALRWAWRPAVLSAPAAVPARGLLASAIGCLMVISPLGILFGFPSLTVIAAIELLGLLVLVALWYTGRRAAPAKGQP